MVETLLARSFANKRGWGEPDESLPLVERSRVLNEQLRLRDTVSEQVESAQNRVSGLLTTLLDNHANSGLIRTGTTLKDGTGLMREQAELLIDALFEGAESQSRTIETLRVIEEAVARYFVYLESELKRIVEKVKFELQDNGRSARFQEAAARLWSGERACLVTKLEHHRASFLAGPRAQPADEPQAEGEMESQDPEPQDEAPEPQAGEAEATEPEALEPQGSEPVVTKLDAPVCEDTSAPPAFAVLAGTSQPETDSTVEEIVLAGQPVTNVRFNVDRDDKTEDAVIPTDAEASTNDVSWRDVWADLIVDILNGRIRPRTQDEWRDALTAACTRQDVVPGEAAMEECSRLLWWKLVGSQHVLSRGPATAEEKQESPQLVRIGLFGTESDSILSQQIGWTPGEQGRGGDRTTLRFSSGIDAGQEASKDQHGATTAGPHRSVTQCATGSYSIAAPPVQIG